MKKQFLSRLVGCAALSLMAAGLAGCPSPVLLVTPAAVDFGPSVQTSIRIENRGGGSLAWTLSEVVRASRDAEWVAGDVPWLSAEAESGTVQGGTLRTLRLEADTSGLPAGTLSNIGVRIQSNGGTAIVPLSITISPTLVVSPTVLNLGPSATQGSFTVSNTGNNAAAWSVLLLNDPNDFSNTSPLPADITVQPSSFSTNPNSSTAVNVSWPAGRDSFVLLVQSSAGSTAVRFNFGTALSTLSVRPLPLRLYFNNQPAQGGGTVEQVASNLTIENTTGGTVTWTLEGVNRLAPATAPPISFTPATGSTPGLGTSTVSVRVSNTANPANVATGSGNYELILRSGDGFIVIPIVVEVLSLPIIAVSEPPDDSQGRPEIIPLDLIDLGRESIRGEFWIANIGPRGSQLNFQISHEDEGAANPLLISVEPRRGTPAPTGSDFVFPGENFRIDGIPVSVVIDRTNLREAVEFRKIIITAWDQDYQEVLEPVEKKEVLVRVERAPLKIEGAINRSRPPFLMRFVFLLRDSIGRVIPASQPGILDRLSFAISEEGEPLDVNETNFFVRGPEGLKTNLVLLLDYTGSMYNAGTQDAQNPLARGEAVAQVKAAARSFIKDLPDGYNLQLMYYNDRQQRNRLIHPFSSDRDSLIAALDAFTLPASLFGVSTIREALLDAIVSLAVQDGADTLPFDEADVRAVLYITDGLDNASITTDSDLESAAEDARVRLYPLVYAVGERNGAGSQIVLAENSGGHMYFARSVPELTALLASPTGIELTELESSNNRARFQVDSRATANQRWEISVLSGAGIIGGISPQISQGSAALNAVDVTLLPQGLVPGEPVSAQLRIQTTPDTGDGFVTITATPTLSGGQLVFLPENISQSFRDPLGTVWNELSNQVVMTYVTPKQDSGDYNIRVSYLQDDNTTIAGDFEEDGVFAPGDIVAGQLALVTSGIVRDPGAAAPEDRTRAEIYLRADYVPRDVTSFRVRFVMRAPGDAPAGAAAALAQAQMRVELAPGGLLLSDDPFAPTWRLLPEGDGIFRMRTEGTNDLLYGSFGNLLKITVNNLGAYVNTFAGLTRQAEFSLGMRVDNDEYFLPAGGGLPSRTKYFLYPGGPAFFDPESGLPSNQLGVVLDLGGIAGPAPNVFRLQNPGYDPELAFPWDVDGDGIGDFQDPEPLDATIPSGLLVPSTFEIRAGVTTFAITLRNNRLDTFTWSVNAASLPPWITGLSFANGPGPLAPGASDTITVTVSRAGLSDVVLPGRIEIVTDLFGVEDVDLTLVVPPV